MVTVDYTELYDNILPYLPGVETGVVDLQIRRTLREFFKRTTLWRETFEFLTVDGQSLYQLLPTAGAVHSVMTVSVNDTEIPVLVEAARPTPAEAAIQTASQPTKWYSTYPNLLSLDPRPTADHRVSCEAVITVALDPTVKTFPADAYREYGEEIASGALAGLMMMPKKPWSDKEAAGYHAGKFVRTIVSVRSRMRDGGRPNVTTARGPTFGK